MSPSIFTVSLDFELHWGVFDKRDRRQRMQNYLNTRQSIKPMLEAFEKAGVGVTWATVGSLFCMDEQHWRQRWPQQLPGYAERKYSAYDYIDANPAKGNAALAHFAPELVALIKQYEGQELATHSFAHYYCLEPGQTAEQFRADLKAAQALAFSHFGETMKSLVFPRNQFNDDYLRICAEEGITSIRSNPGTWYWTGVANDNTSLLRKIFRTGDVYLPMGPRSSYPVEAVKKVEDLPLQIPASRLFRQHDAKRPILNKLRLRRVLAEMTAAARLGEVYHLWWHPENFGDFPKESMAGLEVILAHYHQLHKQQAMISLPMCRYTELLS